MRGHPPAELPSLCIRKAKREAWACLSGCLLLSLRAGLQWMCLALGKEEAPRATVAGGAALVPCRREAGPSAEVLWESCCGVRTGVCPGASPGAWSSASLNLVVSLPAASGSKDQSPAVVVTIVTISALLVLGSVMSVLAIWRR